MKKVLFVCTGNTCRSPMAEAILKNKNLDNVEAKSAGIYAMTGGDSSPQTQEVLKQNNIDHKHSSTAFGVQEAAWADYILTMTKSHKEFIQAQYPEHGSKVYTLKEFVGESALDVSDPYGGSVETYQETYNELNILIDKLVEKLQFL